MSIALLGIVSLQYAMIRDSYVQKEQLFDQNVKTAMLNVVNKVEKMEAMDFIEMKSRELNKIYVNKQKEYPVMEFIKKIENKNESKRKKSQQELERHLSLLARDKQQLNINRDSLRKLANEFEFKVSNKSFEMHFPEVRVWNDSTFVNNIVIQSDVFASSPPAPPVPPRYLQRAPVAVYEQVEHPLLSEKKTVKLLLNDKRKKSEDLFKDLAAELEAIEVPLEKRIKPDLIDSLLNEELQKRGITLHYELEINGPQKAQVFFTSMDSSSSPKTNLYTSVLFENLGKGKAPRINLSFPDKEKMLQEQMSTVLASSVILLLVLVACFVYTIQAILKQKKLSDLKNDFINNMTHEFKTPVSTILLASEALKDPSVIKDEPRVQRLAGIIYDENLRLGEHVERVLNMARMDKGEIRLAMNSVSLHDIIQEVLKHFELSLQNKEQKIQLQLNASNDLVYADAFHLKNIIQNLVDNASKYSKNDSKIFIETELQAEYVKLKVRDQGIGMKKEQIKKIFEPFYRVPTGNLHDVKGFGIGLHYVYSILKAMGGKITVKSELGLGSEFSILIPKK